MPGSFGHFTWVQPASSSNVVQVCLKSWNRVQEAVDRRFYRDAERTLNSVAVRVAEIVIRSRPHASDRSA